MSSENQLLIAVVAACLIMGYGVVSIAIKAAAKLSRTEHRRAETVLQSQTKKGDDKSLQEHYRRVLGVGENATNVEIQIAYTQLISRYNPDAVRHLGKDFYDLAAARTKEIVEAYKYLMAERS